MMRPTQTLNREQLRKRQLEVCQNSELLETAAGKGSKATRESRVKSLAVKITN